MNRRRVVVTGLGATTPLGGDVTSTWAGLLAGTSGVRSLTEDWAQTIPVTFAARVAVEPSEQMERVELRRLDRSEQFGLIASREAWKDAGSPEVDKERLGVVVASGIGGVTTLLEQYDILNSKGSRLVSPHTVPMLMPNGPAANVGLELQAKAGVHTPVSACASGAEAAGYALEMIRNNRADIVVSGGVEAACHALPMAAFAAMKALSTRNDEPARASRPYDLNRDGFVLGEGGGILVLEEYEHAKKRGAKIYAEVLGGGMSGDAYHMTQPAAGGEGVARAMVAAGRFDEGDRLGDGVVALGMAQQHGGAAQAIEGRMVREVVEKVFDGAGLVHEILGAVRIDRSPGIAAHLQRGPDDTAIGHRQHIGDGGMFYAGIRQNGRIGQHALDRLKVHHPRSLARDRARDQHGIGDRREHRRACPIRQTARVQRPCKFRRDVVKLCHAPCPDALAIAQRSPCIRRPDPHVGRIGAGENLAHKTRAGRGQRRPRQTRSCAGQTGPGTRPCQAGGPREQCGAKRHHCAGGYQDPGRHHEHGGRTGAGEKPPGEPRHRQQ